MGNFFDNAVRHPEDIGVGHIRRRIIFNQTAFPMGIVVGALDKGSIPLRAYAIINTPFNAGTTNVLTLGDSAVVDSLVTNANSAAGVAGVKAGTGIKLGAELPADTKFLATFTQTGAAATTGDVTFVVEFVNARNWSDNYGAQLA